MKKYKNKCQTQILLKLIYKCYFFCCCYFDTLKIIQQQKGKKKKKHYKKDQNFNVFFFIFYPFINHNFLILPNYLF